MQTKTQNKHLILSTIYFSITEFLWFNDFLLSPVKCTMHRVFLGTNIFVQYANTSIHCN